MTSPISMDHLADDRRIIHEGKCSTTEEFFSFTALELSVGTIWHYSEEYMFDADTLEPFDLMTTSLDHTTDLSIFTFCEDNSKCIRARTFYFAGKCLDKFRELEESWCASVSESFFTYGWQSF
jgi:hypothetical protein